MESGAGLDATFDEYFYRCHRVHVAYSRGLAPLEHARRAAQLEDAIFGAALGMGRPDDFAYSQGAWSLLSVLTRAGLLDEAEAALAAVLADGKRFAARMCNSSATAEQVLVAGLCIFFERDLERARPLVERIGELVREPCNPELLYGLACFHARMGERGHALERLEQAIGRGFDRAHAATDSDLKGLHGDPRFELAVSPPRGPQWTIDSQPPGALISIDGKSTGQRTPAHLPVRPKGSYQICLSLEGHADTRSEHHQSSDQAGLSMTLRLESLDVRAERARMAEDSLRRPDHAARAATRDFLGSDEDWRRATITAVRHTTYGLGEGRITVHGDGRVATRALPFMPNQSERNRTATLDAAETRALFEAFVEEAFTTIVIGPHTGVADELYFTLSLTNARGQTHSLGKFVHTEHRRFDALVRRVFSSVEI